MKGFLLGIGMVLALSAAGCAENVPSEPEAVGTAREAFSYEHLWDVYTIENGVRHDYYEPSDVPLLEGLGFPLSMSDSGSNPSDNSGTICAWLPATSQVPAHSECIYSNDFSGPNFIHTEGGGSEYPKDIHVTKPLNSGNWKAQWGTGGPGYSYSYYASYGG